MIKVTMNSEIDVYINRMFSNCKFHYIFLNWSVSVHYRGEPKILVNL